MTLKPEERHPSYSHQQEDFTKTNYLQWDAVLAEMQSVAHLDWKKAATIADREHAVAAFGHATKARERITEYVFAWQRDKRNSF